MLHADAADAPACSGCRGGRPQLLGPRPPVRAGAARAVVRRSFVRGATNDCRRGDAERPAAAPAERTEADARARRDAARQRQPRRRQPPLGIPDLIYCTTTVAAPSPEERARLPRCVCARCAARVRAKVSITREPWVRLQCSPRPCGLCDFVLFRPVSCILGGTRVQHVKQPVCNNTLR